MTDQSRAERLAEIARRNDSAMMLVEHDPREIAWLLSELEAADDGLAICDGYLKTADGENARLRAERDAAVAREAVMREALEEIAETADNEDCAEPLDFLFETARAALAAAEQRAGVPEGWKLVPVEPTDMMLHAAIMQMHSRQKWLAMPSAAPQPPESGWQGVISDIVAERTRQIESEGWTYKHDDNNSRGELAGAASCYAYAGSVISGREAILGQPKSGTDFIMRLWPWDWSWWKPTGRRRDLIKAGALIVAEIERLDRASPPPPDKEQGQ